MMGSDQRRLRDQSACRFMKLQDSLGERVLPGILTQAQAQAQEPLPPEATFAEKLQRLERLAAGAGDLLLLWSGVEHYCAEHLG